MAAFGLRIAFGLNRAELAAGNPAAAPFALTRPCTLGHLVTRSALARSAMWPTMLS
jgi:hypothetical protein